MGQRMIYTSVVIDMMTSEVVSSEGFLHDGPVAECGGGGKGGGGGTTVTSVPDKEFNARIAAVQEAMQAMSEDYFKHWSETQAPLEAAQTATDLRLQPYQEALQTGQLVGKLNNLEAENALTQETTAAQRYLLPLQTQLTGAKANAIYGLIPGATEAAGKFLSESSKGVNAEEWAGQAGADVQISAQNTDDQLRRNAARMGVNPNSGLFTRASQDAATKTALGKASAMTTARRAAEDENFKRLNAGASFGAGLFGG